MRDGMNTTTTPDHQHVASLTGGRVIIAILLGLLAPLAVACGADDGNQSGAVTSTAATSPRSTWSRLHSI